MERNYETPIEQLLVKLDRLERTHNIEAHLVKTWASKYKKKYGVTYQAALIAGISIIENGHSLPILK